MNSDLKSQDIKVGHTYKAKRFKETPWANNNRTIIWIGDNGYVQYDGDTVKTGNHFPSVSMEKFLKWVKKDVTDE